MAATADAKPTPAADGGTAGVAAAAPQPDLRAPGPYGVVVLHDSLRVPRPDRPLRPTRLALTVSAPAVAPADPPLPGPPFPVVLLMNGFQARAAQYAPFARRLASWGYLVVQYTAPALTIIHDDVELSFAPRVLDWLADAAGRESNVALHGRPDLTRVFVAGHSRGAKLAALHYAASLKPGASPSTLGQCYPLRGAFLMDPVDNTAQTPESDAYPSAIKALASAGARVGITGAGVVGATNPEGSNWRQFWASSAPGSWLGVLPRAGHTKWLQGPPLECWFLDAAFGGGSAARRTVLEATAACMVAWFSHTLASGDGGAPSKAAADPLEISASAAASPAQVRVAAAAVYGTVGSGKVGGEGGGCGGGDGGDGVGALPAALSSALGPLVDAGEVVFASKGGACTAHPL
ncbi:hypothetical protein Rsub_09747 [Raphidocelis subcapitata]|uniref:Chlorophyllase n=1 Tax=Raphidocelis subcapitata TaxID=307507 RepID=A0A2V0PDU5_9CHLO|nr:hypothetical protein Rsub_09747 [Raphidocelis subcapitata]|eukprot:GBF97689.1 hypothetical protein Rsub_09747 [Raphidocelis subcapitata]